MSTMFYTSFEAPDGQPFGFGVRKVKAYDTANGVRWIPSYSAPKQAMIYHNSLQVNGLYDTEEEALRAWGEWSEREVQMPDGSVMIPIQKFHSKSALDMILKPWLPGTREIWPGEPGWGV